MQLLQRTTCNNCDRVRLLTLGKNTSRIWLLFKARVQIGSEVGVEGWGWGGCLEAHLMQELHSWKHLKPIWLNQQSPKWREENLKLDECWRALCPLLWYWSVNYSIVWPAEIWTSGTLGVQCNLGIALEVELCDQGIDGMLSLQTSFLFFIKSMEHKSQARK